MCNLIYLIIMENMNLFELNNLTEKEARKENPQKLLRRFSPY